MIRTPDLLITNELLYRLSYTGLKAEIIACRRKGLQALPRKNAQAARAAEESSAGAGP